jgi:hypothetical protein
MAVAPEPESRRHAAGVRNTVAVLAFATLGLAIIVITWRPNAASRADTGTPEFRVYAAGVMVLWALLPVVWSAGWNSLAQLGHNPAATLRRTAPYMAIAVAGAIVAIWLSIGFARVRHHGEQFGLARTLITYAAALIAAVPAFVSIWQAFIDLAKRQPVDETGTASQVEKRVTFLLAARSALQFCSQARSGLRSLPSLAHTRPTHPGTS